MSKAFTREDDLGDAHLPPLVSPLPAGTPNLMTSAGRAWLEAEAGRLAGEKSRLLLNARTGGGSADVRAELARVEQRLNYVGRSLRSAEVMAPPAPPYNTVKFGAKVLVKEINGRAMVYRIVGADETEAGDNRVSFFSPIGRALLNARVGSVVTCRLPHGTTKLEIVTVSFPT